jgi:hypothetical protein
VGKNREPTSLGNLPAEGPAAPHPAASGPSLAGLMPQFRCTSHLQPGLLSSVCMQTLSIMRSTPVLTVGSVGALVRGYMPTGP